MIDYLGVLDYLERNREIPYHNPDGETNPNELHRLNEIKDKGQIATSEIKKIAELCSEKFGLDKCLPVSWLDGSGTKTRKYLWAQMKYKDYEASPISISIFVEMFSDAEACFRISLEIKNDGTSDEVMNKYHTHLDLPLDPKEGLSYFAGSNRLGRPQKLNEPLASIKSKIASKQYRKVQISKYINKGNSDNLFFEREMLKAVKSLIPYYRYVLDLPPILPEDFDPGITKEKWLELLNDSSIFDANSLLVMASIFNLGGEATCSQLEKKYGRPQGFYNIVSTKLAARITNAVKIDNIPINEYGTESRWRILYTGRDAQNDESGVWVWKLRPTLYEALKEFDILKYLPQGGEETMTEYSKNMILYGPPGTGKTYSSVNYAVAICEGKKFKDVCNEDYADVIERYNELKAAGQIAFTTFHQSYGYEEFIEGIKPETDENGNIKYDIKDGIFKAFCKKAHSVKINTSEEISVPGDTMVWEVKIKESVIQDCFENGRIRIDFAFDEEGASPFVNDIRKGDMIVTSVTSRSVINGIAIVLDDEAYVLDSDSNTTTRNVKWLATGISEKIMPYNNGKILHRATVARAPHINKDELLRFVTSGSTSIVQNEEKPYVFIIDEINRGNISKIFGELITLMEDTKRKGCLEAASAILPYSGEEFSIPNNVYILGTMNTADRSIALMDTALRRRFQFVEMMPDAKVLRKIGAGYVDGFDVAQMLEIINERIIFLYDREHTIGHAFFTKLKDYPSIGTLALIFKEKIIPLLQEYFYEDYRKIRMVLGDDGKDRELQFVWEDNVESQLFKSDFSAVTDIAEKRYTINEKAFDNMESYKKII